MSAPSRRGLFALLAGALATPWAAKAAAVRDVFWRFSPWQKVPSEYLVTQDVYEDDLYEEVSCRRADMEALKATLIVKGPIYVYGTSDIHQTTWP
jgi:hypothetical protein